MQELQHRHAVAVRLLVFKKAAQLCLVEGTNAVSQFGQRQLVVVRQWQFLTMRHTYRLPTTAPP
jgi:hypothetical protein